MTRDAVPFFAISPGPYQEYFRHRFVSDMRANPPDVFIDTVTNGAFMWPDWTESYGYESAPELRDFINENYVLVDTLVLANGLKPVRFFARRTAASDH